MLSKQFPANIVAFSFSSGKLRAARLRVVHCVKEWTRGGGCECNYEITNSSRCGAKIKQGFGRYCPIEIYAQRPNRDIIFIFNKSHLVFTNLEITRNLGIL